MKRLLVNLFIIFFFAFFLKANADELKPIYILEKCGTWYKDYSKLYVDTTKRTITFHENNGEVHWAFTYIINFA